MEKVIQKKKKKIKRERKKLTIDGRGMGDKHDRQIHLLVILQHPLIAVNNMGQGLIAPSLHVLARLGPVGQEALLGQVLPVNRVELFVLTPGQRKLLHALDNDRVWDGFCGVFE